PAHDGSRIELRVFSAGERHGAGRLVGNGVELLVTGHDPRVHLRGAHDPVWEIEVAHRALERGEREPVAAARARLGARGRVGVPAHGDQDVSRGAGRDGARGMAERRDRARATHVERGREAQVGNAQVRGELLGAGVRRRRDEPVDVAGREAGIGDRRMARLEHPVDRGPGRAAHVARLADADDGWALHPNLLASESKPGQVGRRPDIFARLTAPANPSPLALRLVPALDSLRGYGWESARADFVAGLTVAAVAVPQAMA